MNHDAAVKFAIALAIKLESSQLAQAIEAAVQAEKQAGLLPAGKADAATHEALDTEFGAHFGDGRAAPGWVHDLVDWIWDLIF